MAAGEALPLLSKGNDKAPIAFKGPAVSHIVSKERRWGLYSQNTLMQFLFKESWKLHSTMNCEQSSVLEVLSPQQYCTVKPWVRYLERVLSLRATVLNSMVCSMALLLFC